MGLNWEALSLSGYFEALEANNEASEGNPDKPDGPPDTSRLKRAMEALG